MADSTYQKTQQVLSDLIDRYGRVFWYDEGGQMQLFALKHSLTFLLSKRMVIVYSSTF